MNKVPVVARRRAAQPERYAGRLMNPNSNDHVPSHLPREESGYYEPYADYHRNVRLWFLAYGIGAPVLLAQVDGALTALRSSGVLKLATALFLAGVAIQVVAALLYKTAMWYLYMDELGHIAETSFRVRVSCWLSAAYWFEALLDVATLACFGIATWCVVGALA